MVYPVKITHRNGDPNPGKEALEAYQLLISEARRREHEIVVNSITQPDKHKLELLRKELSEIDQTFFVIKETRGGEKIGASAHDISNMTVEMEEKEEEKKEENDYVIVHVKDNDVNFGLVSLPDI